MAGRTIAMTVARGVTRQALEHWQVTLAAAAGAIVTALVAWSVGGRLIRKRRETLMDRTLRYLNGVEKYREQVARTLRNLRAVDVNGDTVTAQFAKKIRTVEADLKAADQVLSAFRSRREQLARRLDR